MQETFGSFAPWYAVVAVLAAVSSPVAAQNFAAGDHVDARLNGRWFPCTVFKPEPNWLVPNSTVLRGIREPARAEPIRARGLLRRRRPHNMSFAISSKWMERIRSLWSPT